MLNVAMAQCPAIIRPEIYVVSRLLMMLKGWDEPVDNPRMTPIPTPLAIPLNKLFREHGISVICFALYLDVN